MSMGDVSRPGVTYSKGGLEKKTGRNAPARRKRQVGIES